MTTDYLTLARNEPQLTAAAIVALVGLATIGGFFFFQYVVGPGRRARSAWSSATPITSACRSRRLLWLGAGYGAQRKVLLLGFLVIAAAMLWNTGLSTYHAGIEWKWWPGPQECTGPIEQCRRRQGSAQASSTTSARSAATRRPGASSAFRSPAMMCWCRLALAIVALWGARASLARSNVRLRYAARADRNGSSHYRRRHRRTDARPDAASRRHRLPHLRGGAANSKPSASASTSCRMPRANCARSGWRTRSPRSPSPRANIASTIASASTSTASRPGALPATTCRNSPSIAAICRWCCSTLSSRAPAATR